MGNNLKEVNIMETLFELRADNGFCRVFDFFADASNAMSDLIMRGIFARGELYITRIVSE